SGRGARREILNHRRQPSTPLRAGSGTPGRPIPQNSSELCVLCGNSQFSLEFNLQAFQGLTFQGLTRMRFLRTLIFAIILASAFFYFTTFRNGNLHPANWISHPQHAEITEAAGSESLDAEEQNNINVY